MAGRHTGFSLIELVVTLTIVSILASALIPLGQWSVKRQQEAELRQALRDIRSAIDMYKKAVEDGKVVVSAESSGYPPNLEVLANGMPDASSEKKRLIRFLRRLPRDPMFPEKGVPAQDTWGKRSYASPPDAPQAGADVFDVYSLSTGTGLNGIAYREW
ncbi:type II secretion system GspH family protein [Methylobacillus arboreus]|uniref:type II secretion system protein n=1 Tax=Methylobacillus arboreus TaxID=755170 RepID=UPI001E372FC5|nr:type II secretion system protein [Methylobacillus arboreus]MCB5190623.1 type II secretion system GspH family protein [Methylobacillus arboreus]